MVETSYDNTRQLTCMRVNTDIVLGFTEDKGVSMTEKSSRVWRGFAAVTGSLLVFALFGTQCSYTYEGSINSALGTSSTKVVKQDAADAKNTIVYPSSYGELNAQNLQKLIKDTYAQSVAEQEEGSVLLTNNNSALPLAGKQHVTLFGHAVVQPVYSPGGANSAADKTGKYVVDLKSALESAGFSVNNTVYDAYAKSSTTRVASNSLQTSSRDKGKKAADPVLGEEPASFYTDQLKSSWQNDYNDVAIVMLAREGGEDKDMMMQDPDGISALSLHKDERDMLQMIKDSGKFNKTIVLLNSAFPMEVGWLNDYNVDACMWIGNPGQRGFEGVANLLVGKANPSGRLTDTYAVDSLSSPAVHTGGQHGNQWKNTDEVNAQVSDEARNIDNVNVQSEGIYIGYKYYETRYADAIQHLDSGASSAVGASHDAQSWNYNQEVSYPFGYGLSYTSFSQKLDKVSYDKGKDTFTATVTVTNTGNTDGASVVQLYAQTPYGDYERQNHVEKSAIQLAGQGRTETLKPGESQTVDVTVDRYLLASYDYTKAKGYILSAGDYYFAIGDNAHDALNNILAAQGASGMVDVQGKDASGDVAKTYTWNYKDIDTKSYAKSKTGVKVTNQFDNANPNYWKKNSVTFLARSDWEGTFPTKPVELTATADMIELLKGEYYKKSKDAKSVKDYTQGTNNSLTFAMMKDVDYNDESTWDKYLDQMTIDELTSQLADLFGTPEVSSVNRPEYHSGDGTASVGGNTYDKSYGDARDVTLYPSTVVLASTWDTARMQRRGELVGEEALYAHVPLTWAGGGNLHRTPFGGRNGEYWSEDSVLTYLDNKVELAAAQKKGLAAGVKHVAGNDQELYREGLNMFFNEQAFREGALKGVEGIVSDDNATALMMSFNRLGVVWSSASTALTTQVVRNEWGFKGMIETDAVAGAAYKSHFPTTLAAGVTTYCIDPEKSSTAAIKKQIEDQDDGQMLGILRNAVKNLHYTLAHSNMVNGLDTSSKIERITPWWRTAIYSVEAALVLLTLGSAVMMVRSARRNRAAAQQSKAQSSSAQVGE